MYYWTWMYTKWPALAEVCTSTYEVVNRGCRCLLMRTALRIGPHVFLRDSCSNEFHCSQFILDLLKFWESLAKCAQCRIWDFVRGANSAQERDDFTKGPNEPPRLELAEVRGVKGRDSRAGILERSSKRGSGKCYKLPKQSSQQSSDRLKMLLHFNYK